MTPDELRDICLALPQTTETFPFGEGLSVFKTSGNDKIFALSALDAVPLSVSLKCDPEESLALRQQYAAITPGYHLNKKHWVTISIDGTVASDDSVSIDDSVSSDDSAPADRRVPDSLIEQLLHDSHALVRPKVPRSRG
ncbi:MmcQ/YjbR family DNA-binding protein [Lacisediminihabitans changchengi]|uniref:MmcQ/YjbR family DNA-binding protein n=1 Tax=Lacisediminihabitans changchengi TaxID=2787634 RepID=A0A934SMY2_9MICO|nr:MmcQ/YjbR family DNA-binding protein [Lacisediminihabitans changchengi]MBK4346925.1 MmcQ/YjbR family DNA-binding protein [Lacisediminihabitans changchengi]MBK4347952.1 MmcQ/YjbR family DNA-binding protein [Lacisediminihabitans changchengi]